MKQSLLMRIIDAGVIFTFAVLYPIYSQAEGPKPFDAPGAQPLGAVPVQPFANNNGLIPPTSQYSGPMFQLSHNWPAATPPPIKTPPWVQAIGGQPINVRNAGAYVQALKDYVAPNAQQLIWNYQGWDAAKAGWYNQPWLGSIRESIHGTYTGSQFPPSTFPGTGLTKTITTYVLTYYDARAAYTVGRVWGKTAIKPTITTASTQAPEGAVIVKAAFIDATGTDWPVMAGAATWPLYAPINDAKTPPSVTPASFMQFDIIVKDTQSSPKTGWVFSTLVYDSNTPGEGWDKMVPLGAMWGNDPNVNSAIKPSAPLAENWINPNAPLYSRQTLGWGGRLSGPNDGAVNNIKVGNQKIDNAADSSCMSCHSPAEWPMKSFLLPATTYPPSTDGNYIISPAPGSPEWMQWFQDRPGTQPKDAGTVALDYDMVFAFKSLPLWAQAMGNKPIIMFKRSGKEIPQQQLQYNGLPEKK